MFVSMFIHHNVVSKSVVTKTFFIDPNNPYAHPPGYLSNLLIEPTYSVTCD